jgi:predicted secreted acid phosphatase
VKLPTIKRPARTAIIVMASAAVGMALTVPGIALATNSGQAVPAPPAVPTSASQIQNVDQVKTAIKGYYGDHVVNLPAGMTLDGQTSLHQYSPDSNYAAEVEGIDANAGKYLAQEAKPKQKHSGAPAVLFDIDDTTLNTFSYEIFSGFVFNPATNADFVNAGSAAVFPAVPGMVDLEHQALAEGYQVFFLTGRPLAQQTATLANLRDAGYAVTDANVYLKDSTAATEPWLASCVVPAPTTTDPNATKFVCSTTQYKSMTRQHIESLGSAGTDIVANFGDQFSDLNGGFADRTFKIPNPMYFLP